jgi:acetyl-CoA carboxylase biotin carboxylase subunit
MIRVADGEKLSFKQDEITINGWAIECRINAEDVQANFSPNLGVIERLSFPKGKNIRVDTGVRNGSEITPFFDSMVAKLIIYGEDRKTAIANTMAALKKIRIQGLKTTLPFFKQLLSNKKFKAGKINTSFIEKDMEQLFYQEPDEEILAAFLATYDYALELQYDDEAVVDYSTGKNLTPWVLNKRLKSL